MEHESTSHNFSVGDAGSEHRLLERQAFALITGRRVDYKCFVNSQIEYSKKSHLLMTKSKPDVQSDPWDAIFVYTIPYLKENCLKIIFNIRPTFKTATFLRPTRQNSASGALTMKNIGIAAPLILIEGTVL